MTPAQKLPPARNFKPLIWFAVLSVSLICGTHLVRSAIKADQTKSIIIAFLILGVCLLLRVGADNSKPGQSQHGKKRRYIPWSAIPLLLLAIWAANRRLFGKFDVSAVFFHMRHSLKYNGIGDDIFDFASYIFFALVLIACISYLAKRDKRVVWLERIGAAALLLANPVMTYAYDQFLNPDRNTLDLMTAYQPVTLTAQTKPAPNLLIIYLESMEATYANPIFGDIYTDLEALSENGLRLDGLKQVEDTGWTIAGMVASQCGVPLLSYGLVMKNRIKNIDHFMPNAECLATRLTEHGYQTHFFGGGPLSFAGKGTFLKTHGYQTAIGLDEIPEAQQGNVNKWGIFDDRLYELALKEIETLSEADAPFLMSILTLGAHTPKGFPAPSCYDTIENADTMDSTFLSVACTSQLTRNFLETAQARGFLDNTVVVLLSDHLSHKNRHHLHLKSLNRLNRENFFLIMGPEIKPERRTQTASMMDIYPTLLDSLGLLQAQDTAALGTSLLSGAPTLLETHGPDTLNLAIRSDKVLRKHLWDLNEPAAPAKQ